MELTVDGQKLAAGFAAISDSISLIPQEPEIFAATIKENITMGIEQDLATIKRFARMALFADVVRRLPNGYDSSVVEKGVNLSGGEKQRLALARGLLASQDKDIILLDEPTSSVDFHNELAIYENLFDEFKDKTIISAVHKLYLLPMFDKIYFLKNGQMIASGSFEELKNNSADFKNLWEEYIAKN
jgi:ABC-type multidrug transport system fused ATPase/permease subunit